MSAKRILTAITIPAVAASALLFSASAAPAATDTVTAAQKTSTQTIPSRPQPRTSYADGYRDGFRTGFSDGRDSCRVRSDSYGSSRGLGAYNQGFVDGYKAGFEAGLRTC